MKVLDEKNGMVLLGDETRLKVIWNTLPTPHERAEQRAMAANYLVQSTIKYLTGGFR